MTRLLGSGRRPQGAGLSGACRSNAAAGRTARRGSVYLATLSCALLVTLIGVSALLAIRVRLRDVQANKDAIAARHYAHTAIELGIYAINADASWRQTRVNGEWGGLNFGHGKLTLSGIDPTDSDLADAIADPLVLIGSGMCGDAVYHERVTLVPPEVPLPALNTCVHTGTAIQVSSGASVTATGAPLSTNGSFVTAGTVNADVEALTVFESKPINGNVTTGAAAKDLPDPNVYDYYLARATEIPFASTIQGVVLSPASNPFGNTNAEGVYYINAGGSDLRIQGTRVCGTLIVRTGGAYFRLGPQVHFSPARADFPVLIVKGTLDLEMGSGTALRESDWSTSFNPPGTPYEGVADIDNSDTYPTELRGLVHVIGTLYTTHSDSARVKGVVLCTGTFYAYIPTYFEHDPTLYANPPERYISYGTPEISPGTWQQTLTP